MKGYRFLDTKSFVAFLSKCKNTLTRWLLPVTGFLALVWFIVRVLPKPSRATYPCQRLAGSLASGFMVWLTGLSFWSFLVANARKLWRKSRYLVAGMCFGASVCVFTIWWSPGMTGERVTAGTFTPSEPPNCPIGTPKGIYPGRVVWVHDPNATSWDGSTGYWSDDNNIDQDVVNEMFSKAICWLTGQDDDPNAWDAIFRHFNEKRGKGLIGYQGGEKVAVKVNMVNCHNHGNPGNASYNSPQLIYALLCQLVNKVGMEPSDITVYDASSFIPGPIYDRCSVGDLMGVRFVDNLGGDGRIKAEREPNSVVCHADPNVPPRWLPRCVAEAAYIVNLAHLKGHYLTGVTLCAKNHFGSTWVQADSQYAGWMGREGFWPGRLIHNHINAYDTTQPESLSSFKVPARPMGSYNPLVELMGHKDVGDKTVLFMIDALYAAKHQSAAISESPKWISPPFDNDWTSSVFASQDGVAIDSVGLDFLRCEPTVEYVADDSNYSTADDYLHEAAQADNPASGRFYDPEGDGIRMASLGVHEHWNNALDKQYSRNLGVQDGIELISEKPEYLPGDLNLNGIVDDEDLSIFCSQWLKLGSGVPADIAPEPVDGIVNCLDFAKFAQSWRE
ncbi:MAG TPA: DUF362 domain-containing protein [Planctomycetes bacterium]|nr:DUF362 domain-containing protein [Planctomycetota bacterium]